MQQPGAYVGGAVDLFDAASAVTNKVTRNLSGRLSTLSRRGLKKTFQL